MQLATAFPLLKAHFRLSSESIFPSKILLPSYLATD